MKTKTIMLMGLAMVAGSLCASAQEKGDMAVGINLGVAPCLEKDASITNFGVGAKFQYNITAPIRVEAAFDYYFKDKGIDVMTVGVNAHYVFKLGNKFGIYPLVGVGYARLSGSGAQYDDEAMDELGNLLGSIGGSAAQDEFNEGLRQSKEGASANKFYFNVGVGAEYSFSSKFSALSLIHI